MNFKEALIAHLLGEKVEVKGESGWHTFPGEYGGSLLCEVLAGLYENYDLRLAPRTIFVNGVEVQAPEKIEPKEGCFVYVADPTSNLHHFTVKWVSPCEQYIEYLKRGLVYLNKEDAIARAKAMLLTSDKKEDKELTITELGDKMAWKHRFVCRDVTSKIDGDKMTFTVNCIKPKLLSDT